MFLLICMPEFICIAMERSMGYLFNPREIRYFESQEYDSLFLTSTFEALCNEDTQIKVIVGNPEKVPWKRKLQRA